MKVFCSPNLKDLESRPNGSLGVLLYSRTTDSKMGSIGTSVREYIEKHKFVPHVRAWDFLSLALSVFAADESVQRADSPDGWTRQIELDVAVNEPDFWCSQRSSLEQALRFLTTDSWRITFSGNGAIPKAQETPAFFDETSVGLLSGGMDSLIGAVDAAARREKVLLVSQVANGDRGRQAEFAKSLGLAHLQLTHGCELPGVNEPSTRSRSIVFVAYGVVAATLLRSFELCGARLCIPENGFISINPPLTDARLGGLSTRTTHPVFLHHLGEVFRAAGLRVRLANPYQFKTKREMLQECLNQEYIRAHAHESTSCGRFVRTGYKHCGRCVPCLVRRSAFHAASLSDGTDYKYASLSKNDADHARFDDVRSAGIAIASVAAEGLDQWMGTSLSSQHIDDRTPYKEVVRRGVAELGAFLKASGVK